MRKGTCVWVSDVMAGIATCKKIRERQGLGPGMEIREMWSRDQEHICRWVSRKFFGMSRKIA